MWMVGARGSTFSLPPPCGAGFCLFNVAICLLQSTFSTYGCRCCKEDLRYLSAGYCEEHRLADQRSALNMQQRLKLKLKPQV
ncbi:hypothetical protein V8E53_005393 [Lactarius tabidus]